MASARDFFLGKPEKTQTFSQLAPNQQQMLQQLLSQLAGPLQQTFGNLSQILSGDPQAFEAFKRPAMREFEEEIIPRLAEGFGGIGATSSSGAQQTFARAGELLTEGLSAQRAGLQQDAMQNILKALGLGIQPTQQTAIYGRTPGFLEGLAPGIGSALGMLPFRPWR